MELLLIVTLAPLDPICNFCFKSDSSAFIFLVLGVTASPGGRLFICWVFRWRIRGQSGYDNARLYLMLLLLILVWRDRFPLLRLDGLH